MQFCCFFQCGNVWLHHLPTHFRTGIRCGVFFASFHNLNARQYMNTSSETATDPWLSSTHPCSADLWDLLLCLFVFTQGLQENEEEWEEEGNLVSDAQHLLRLFRSPFSLFLKDRDFLYLFSLAPILSLFCWVTEYIWGLVKSVTCESGQWMMGCSWPFSLSFPICTDIAVTLAMWLH